MPNSPAVAGFFVYRHLFLHSTMLEKIIIFILKFLVFFGYIALLGITAKNGNILLFFILFFILIAFILIGNMETGISF